MRKLIDKIHSFYLLGICLPLLYGCNNGGGDSGQISGAVSQLISGGSSTPTGGSETVQLLSTSGIDPLSTSVHAPEPATMILMGSGLAALAYFKNRKK